MSAELLLLGTLSRARLPRDRDYKSLLLTFNPTFDLDLECSLLVVLSRAQLCPRSGFLDGGGVEYVAVWRNGSGGDITARLSEFKSLFTTWWPRDLC